MLRKSSTQVGFQETFNYYGIQLHPSLVKTQLNKMCSVSLPTKGASSGSTRWKLASDGLPKENSNHQRDLCLPKTLESRGLTALGNLKVQRLGRKLARGGMRPRDLIWVLRKRRKKRSEGLPINKLFRRECPAQPKVPVSGCKLQNGDRLVGTVGE